MKIDRNKLKTIIEKATLNKSFHKIQKYGKTYFFSCVRENGTTIKRIELYDNQKIYVGKINAVKRTNNEYEVEGFYIDNDEYWGIGLGYYLLQSMIDLLKNDAEAKVLYVKPNSGSIEPLPLYKKYHRQGFKFEDDKLEQQWKNRKEDTDETELFNNRHIKMIMKL